MLAVYDGAWRFGGNACLFMAVAYFGGCERGAGEGALAKLVHMSAGVVYIPIWSANFALPVQKDLARGEATACNGVQAAIDCVCKSFISYSSNISWHCHVEHARASMHLEYNIFTSLEVMYTRRCNCFAYLAVNLSLLQPSSTRMLHVSADFAGLATWQYAGVGVVELAPSIACCFVIQDLSQRMM